MNSVKNSVKNSFSAGPVVQIGTVGGNVTIALDRPDYQVHWLGPTTPPPTYIPERHRTPSRLLDTKQEVVPYLDRPVEQQRLLDWLANPAPASVLLLHGAGGRGKTRLANRLAAHSHTEGWSVAHALNRTTDKPSMLPAETSEAHEPGQEVLVAVDYAERWPSDVLLTLVSDLVRAHAAGKLRVLLLARSIQDLWQPLCDHLDSTPVELPEPVELRDLTGSQQDRAEAFCQAAQAFHSALDLTGTNTAAPPEDLAHDDYASPLILHMAALATVCASRDHEELPHRDELSGYLLAHERRLWPPHPNAGDAVFLATLFGPASNEDAALNLLSAAGLCDSIASGRKLLAWYDRVYPGQNALSPLRPERFGEDFVAAHLRSHPRSEELIKRIERARFVEAPLLPRTTAVLVAAAGRHPHVRDALWRVLDECHSLCYTPSNDLIHLAIAYAPFDVKTVISGHLPPPEIGMRAIAIALIEDLVGNLTDDMPARVRTALLLSPANRFAEADSHLARVEPLMRRAASIMAEIQHLAPEEHAVPTALVSMSSGIHHARAGDLPNAVRKAKDAIEILRGMTPNHDAERDIYLACALANLARYLHDSNREDESAAAAIEALELAEGITENSVTLAELAAAMPLLAVAYADKSQMNEAARAAKVAASTYIKLAGYFPDFYSRAALNSVGSFAVYEAMAGRPEAALRHVINAIPIARRRLETDPHVFETSLSFLLTKAATIETMTSAQGRIVRAQAYAAEAAERLRTLVSSRPDLQPLLDEALMILSEIDRR